MAVSELCSLPVGPSAPSVLHPFFLPSLLVSLSLSLPPIPLIPLFKASEVHLLWFYFSSFSIPPPLTSSYCLCIRINSRRRRRSSATTPRRTPPHRRLRWRQSRRCWRPAIPTPAKQKRTKTKPSSSWSASRPWRYGSFSSLFPLFYLPSLILPPLCSSSSSSSHPPILCGQSVCQLSDFFLRCV